MNATAHNPLNALTFEVPEPPDEFGQDGGKFYRCYDTLADEIDEDLTQGLKEQLDGMLIFAGLFAGVNSAFLALTIPLLSADPADDTNALLAQNNAILMQLLMGRNDTVPANPALPSAEFSPSHDIFTINTLFSLSLAFAIISSFLAMLGRQWLVYYRKRGGGGPDTRRWTQLKRYLGAERWGLEPILDDVLPSLLQIGLIIFCASLVLYLHHLNPTISLIVGIPVYLGLAFFLGSALCIIWDKFCPFHSPLSHLLLLAARSLSWMWGLIVDTSRSVIALLKRDLRWKLNIDYRNRAQNFKQQVRRLSSAWSHILRNGRKEESLRSLQVFALHRTVCTSDDPITLLNAAANIVTISDHAQLKQLFNDPDFRQRFLDVIRNSEDRIPHLRGSNDDPSDIVASVIRLSCSAMAHAILAAEETWAHTFNRKVKTYGFSPTTILIPGPLLLKASSNSIKTTLAFFAIYVMRWGSSDEEQEIIRHHLTACSDALAVRSDCAVETLKEAYRGDINDTLTTLNETFLFLLSPTSRALFNCDIVLANMLRCVARIVENNLASLREMDLPVKLLGSCETVLRSPQLPEAGREVGRNLRISMANYLRHGVFGRSMARWTLNIYLADIGSLERTEFAYHEDIEVLRVFGPVFWALDIYVPKSDLDAFNTFASNVRSISRQIQRVKAEQSGTQKRVGATGKRSRGQSEQSTPPPQHSR
ncbi:hypothetical protein M407DRAFT_17277 [Tulasnella calospora MUT 4182]|uniref:DUF6535 domain-containing protein n=1 Tax=Tulasnella calospora MUT 4182 TaxID=1051891 RepID=A0A0C3QW82_9AGAM|nr:hypothetical protein M407DRAFT_17277 [Tulasnella calospora MUT 4182]